MNTTVYATRGIGFLQALTILFIGLKLTGYIGWSWVWVLSPFWIPAAVAVVCGILYLILDHFVS